MVGNSPQNSHPNGRSLPAIACQTSTTCCRAPGKAAQPKLSQYKRVHRHAGVIEPLRENVVLILEVRHPHWRIDQHHASTRRRGAALSCGSVPPSCASRRALSRSIRALSASRTSAAPPPSATPSCSKARSSRSWAKAKPRSVEASRRCTGSARHCACVGKPVGETGEGGIHPGGFEGSVVPMAI